MHGSATEWFPFGTPAHAPAQGLIPVREGSSINNVSREGIILTSKMEVALIWYLQRRRDSIS